MIGVVLFAVLYNKQFADTFVGGDLLFPQALQYEKCNIYGHCIYTASDNYAVPLPNWLRLQYVCGRL